MAVLLNTMFFQRNPRYLFLLGSFLFCSTLLLIVPWNSDTIPDLTSKFVDYLPTKYRGRMSLDEFVQREEEAYQQLTLPDRQKMMDMYGPEPEKIQS
jgi:hypothetical protein